MKIRGAIFLLALLMLFPACAGDINSGLRNAAIRGDTATVKALLDRGAEVNAKSNDGMTALMWAVAYEHTTTVQVLLDRGADVNAKYNDGKTALDYAAEKNQTEIVSLLKQSPAEQEKAKKIRAEREKAEREERQRREAPANLIASVKFSDSSSFIPNNILDAGETGVLRISIKNNGKGIGFGTVIKLDSTVGQIDIPKTVKIGDIQPGETIEKTIRLKAGLSIPNGHAPILIETKERRGYDAQKVKLTLQTAALIPPKLEIQSVEVNDGKIGLARGNGNGIPENNETIELIAYIKNSGTGDALGVNLDLASINTGLKVIRQKTDIGVIHPGQIVKGKLAFSIPRTFKADQLQYKLKVDDVRGADSQSRQFAAKFSSLASVLAYNQRIYDGDSSNSKGNRNGIIENGETIEVEIIPQNIGDIEARGVEISLDAPYGLSLNKNRFTVGAIPAQAQGEKKCFILSIPRTYQQNKIKLDLRITQADFASLKRTLALKVKPIRPKLSFSQRIIGNIQQRQSAELLVTVRNKGQLDAEDVKVAVGTNIKEINWNAKEKTWGTLPAGSAADLKFSFFVMPLAPPGNLPINISVTQTDFPAISDTLAYNIQEEGVVEVAVKGQKLKSSRPYISPAANFPPTIIIDAPFDGDRVTESEVSLRFRVSDDKEISKVDILVNGINLGRRGIDLQPKSKGERRQFRERKNIALVEGANTIQIIAYDNQNERAEERVTVHYTKELDIGRTFAIIIGIADYEHNGIRDLNYTENDALAIKDFLMTNQGGGVSSERIRFLVGPDATAENIRSAVSDWLPVVANKRNDRVILFFAGHGVKKRNRGYFIAYDTDPDRIGGTSVKMQEITDYLYDVEANTVVFLSDACHSGAAFKQRVATRGDSMDGGFLINQFSGEGRITIAAAKSGQESIELPEYGHGLFTYYLLKGLKGEADKEGNKDKKVDIHELYQYVYEHVSDAAKSRNFSQNPKMDSQVEGDIIIAIVP